MNEKLKDINQRSVVSNEKMILKQSAVVGVALIIFSTMTIHQSALAASSMKTYQDFGMGFKMDYPSNMTVTKTQGNITSGNKVTFSSPIPHSFTVTVRTAPYLVVVPLSLSSGPPSLDTLATLASYGASVNNITVTNKTKLVVDNIPAYLVQTEKKLSNDKTEYYSIYMTLRDGTVTAVAFYATNPTKYAPLEKMMIQSFRFI